MVTKGHLSIIDRNGSGDEKNYHDIDICLNDEQLPIPKLTLTASSIVVFLLSLACFWVSQYGEFAFDDSTAILENEDIRSDTPLMNIFQNDFWGKKLVSKTSHKSYRPLTVLTFRWNYLFSGGYRAWDFHFVNIVLHAIISVFLLRIFSIIIGGVQVGNDGRILFTAPKASFLCGVLFAVHPIHTESVAAVVGRADLICSIFYAISFISYVKYCFKHSIANASFVDLVITITSAGAAMFAKEQGITVLGLCIAFDVIMVVQINPSLISSILKGQQVNWKVNMKSFIQRFVFLLISIITLLLLRFNIMGSQTPTFHYQDNPASFQSSFIFRALNYNYLYSINLWLLLNPWWLCFDWAMGCIPVITSFSDIRLFAPLVMLLMFAFFITKTLANMEAFIGRCFAMCLSFMVIPFLPAMNIFFRVGFVIAERNLYISSIGFIMLIVIAFIMLSSTPNGKRFTIVSSVSLVALFSARSIHRASYWRNELDLFTSGLKVCPMNAKIHYNVAKCNHDKGDDDVAIPYYLEAIRLAPDYDQPMNNLGNIYKDRKMLTEAEYYLERAVNITPTFHTGWMNLGTVKADLMKKEEAVKCYNEAVTHKRNYPDAYYNWGNLYLDYKEYPAALEKYNKALQLKGDHKPAWKNKIIMLGNMGNSEELVKNGKKVVQIFPTDDDLFQTIGNSLGIAGNLKEAERFSKKAYMLNPSNFAAASVLGIIYHRLSRYEEADRYYKLAMNGLPNDEQVKINYGRLKKVWKQ